MPNSVVKSFSRKTGKSIDEIERLWDKSVEIAKKKGLAKDSDRFFAFVVGILKRMLKLQKKEDLLKDDAEAILEGYMDGTPHRIRQTPINSTSKIFKRDSFLNQRKERDKKKDKFKSKSRRPRLSDVSGKSKKPEV